jgi:hypothetical protein
VARRYQERYEDQNQKGMEGKTSPFNVAVSCMAIKEYWVSLGNSITYVRIKKTKNCRM